MRDELPPIPPEGAVIIGSGVHAAPAGGRSLATRDREVIRQWAQRHSAEPALEDAAGDAEIRFNFPALNRHRSVTWQEWFEVFEQRRLVFIYEEDVADRAHELWRNRGAEHGHDDADWLEAEQELQREGVRPSGAYRFLPAD